MAGPVPCTLHDAYMIRKTAVLSTKKTPRVLETLGVFAPLSGGVLVGGGWVERSGDRPQRGEWGVRKWRSGYRTPRPTRQKWGLSPRGRLPDSSDQWSRRDGGRDTPHQPQTGSVVRSHESRTQIATAIRRTRASLGRSCQEPPRKTRRSLRLSRSSRPSPTYIWIRLVKRARPLPTHCHSNLAPHTGWLQPR